MKINGENSTLINWFKVENSFIFIQLVNFTFYRYLKRNENIIKYLVLDIFMDLSLENT